MKDSNLRPLGYEPNSLTADVTRYIWYKWPESNRHARYRRQSLSLLWLPITPHLLGIPQETRTLTNGFGDRRAAITLGRNKLGPTIGFELMTYRLQGDCTTTVLSRLFLFKCIVS